MNQPRVVRDDIIKVLRLLQRPNDRVMRSFQDPNDSSLRFGRPIRPASSRGFAINPHNDPVAVHGGASILSSNKDVWFAFFPGVQKTETGLMN